MVVRVSAPAVIVSPRASPTSGPLSTTAAAGLEPDHAAAGGGDADRAAHLAPVGEAHEPAAHGRGAAAGGAAGHQLRVARIARDAVAQRLRPRPHCRGSPAALDGIPEEVLDPDRHAADRPRVAGPDLCGRASPLAAHGHERVQLGAPDRRQRRLDQLARRHLARTNRRRLLESPAAPAGRTAWTSSHPRSSTPTPNPPQISHINKPKGDCPL
jgi:hypothetical protein